MKSFAIPSKAALYSVSVLRLSWKWFTENSNNVNHPLRFFIFNLFYKKVSERVRSVENSGSLKDTKEFVKVLRLNQSKTPLWVCCKLLFAALIFWRHSDTERLERGTALRFIKCRPCTSTQAFSCVGLLFPTVRVWTLSVLTTKVFVPFTLEVV